MKMKKFFVWSAIVLAALAGCKKMEQSQQQQQQQQQSPTQNITVHSPEKIAVLKSLLQKNPGNVDGWISLGNMLMDSSNFKDAIDAYQKALELTPNNVDVRVDMGTCYRGTGNPLRAVEEYRKAVKINPDHVNAHKNLAVVLAYDLKSSSEAIKEFEIYLKLVPNAPDKGQVMRIIEELKTGTVKK